MDGSSSAALEAELASLALEAESEALRGRGGGASEDIMGGDASIASSQLTAFLVEHGVLSPSKAASSSSAALRPERHPHPGFGDRSASLNLDGSTMGEVDPLHRPEQQQHRHPNDEVSYVIVTTPERPHFEARLEEASAGVDTSDAYHQQQPPPPAAAGAGAAAAMRREDLMAHTPRSGISSLGLASPPHHHHHHHHAPAHHPATAAAAAREEEQRQAEGDDEGPAWLAAVERLLRTEGYRTVGAGAAAVDPGEVVAALRQALGDLRSAREVIRADLLERQRGDSDRRSTEERLAAGERARGSLHEQLHAAELRARELEAEVEHVRRLGQEKLREAKAKAASLAAQLKQSEHRVRARDAHIDKMGAKLEALKQKEAKEKERDRAIFRRLHKREPRHNEGKWMDTIGALESARERSAEEVKALKLEVQSLNDLLKEKENYIVRKETSGAWPAGPAAAGAGPAPPPPAGAVAAGGHGVQQLLEQVHALERALRKAEKRERAAAGRAEAAEREKGALASRLQGLDEAQAVLKKEAQGRPTAKAWKVAQKRLEELEAKLKQAESANSKANRRGAGEAPGTRAVQRLDPEGGGSSEDAREVLAGLYRSLGLREAAQVAPAVDAMRAAMEAIPPLEAFVKDVCGFLARHALPHGAHLSPDAALRRMPMEQAGKVLRSWAQEVEAARRLRRFKSRVRTILSTRQQQQQLEQEDPAAAAAAAALAEGGDDDAVAEDELLATVARLVALEHEAAGAARGREAAEAYLTSQPDLLVNRAVQHFRYLFQVKALEGVFPKMNELYLFSSEMENLTRALKGALKLSPTCPTNKLLAELQAVIRRANGGKSKGTGKGQVVTVDDEEVVNEESGEEEEELQTTVVNETVLSTVVEGDEDAEEEESSESESEESESESSSSSSSEEEEEVSEQQEEEEDETPSFSVSSSVPATPASRPVPAMNETQDDTSVLSSSTAASSSVMSDVRPPPAATSRRSTAAPRDRKPASATPGPSTRHPMLAVLSAAESQESPFLPPPAAGAAAAARRQAGALPHQLDDSATNFDSSLASASFLTVGPEVRVQPQAQGQRRDSNSGRGGGAGGAGMGASSSGTRYFSSSGSGSAGLLGVLSAAEGGGSLPSPAVDDFTLSLSSDEGSQ